METHPRSSLLQGISAPQKAGDELGLQSLLLFMLKLEHPLQIPFGQKMELLMYPRSTVCTAGSEDTECRRVAGLRQTEVLEAGVMKGGGEVVLLITAADDFVAPGNSRLTGRTRHSGRHSDSWRQNCSWNSERRAYHTAREI